MPYRRKLIEVALPLEAINAESAREKSIRHGLPAILHLRGVFRPPSESVFIEPRSKSFDINAHLCYKINTSPLFLRVQGARRPCAASAFLTSDRDCLYKSGWGAV